VVVTFVDITDAKRSERLQAAHALAESIVDAVRDPFLVLDADLRVVRANAAYYREFRAEPAETEDRLIGEIGNEEWNLEMLRERLEKGTHDGTGFDDFDVEIDFGRLGTRTLRLNARPVSPRSGAGAELILLGIQDVTAGVSR
jgi:two-component system CheB/CheR fusion protein